MRRHLSAVCGFAYAIRPQIIALAKEATQTGAPIIRPIWWLGADDEQALVCDDEFLLGDDVLVAPVLQPAARTRDIYLPKGTWRDYWNNEIFEGGRVISAYPAPLEKLPIFLKWGANDEHKLSFSQRFCLGCSNGCLSNSRGLDVFKNEPLDNQSSNS